jgi:hypothetical protein
MHWSMRLPVGGLERRFAQPAGAVKRISTIK